ncbi:Meiotic recombination protein rec8 [Neolecta irregularis DAH-3]|uniref:Meiotic recombination protein rec8 n=1 Tax=Neolecta irregularis (strain DAH-3) TaxID=1198029 RepID=A0A1U7LTB6_NEOID|nr:Meiotic recombination protein rec8 [Neolecta irregularis DAH-3]|eukprot:OLL25915.1 Meiotic recombination protein rec8 [Neolecta irregularis DAH-3]
MFYSQDILVKQKGGFSIIWLAATLGSKASFKKIQKRDIINVDVSKACQYIVQPPEPLALRLSSNLMVGVTRIYSQQCGFLYSTSILILSLIGAADVTNVHSKLNREYSAIADRSDIDLPNIKPRIDFTLQDDPTFTLEYGLGVDFVTQDFLPDGIYDNGHLSGERSSLDISPTQNRDRIPSDSSLVQPLSLEIPFNGGIDSSFNISRGSAYFGGFDDDDILVGGEPLDFEFDADGLIRELNSTKPNVLPSKVETSEIEKVGDTEEDEAVLAKLEHIEAARKFAVPQITESYYPDDVPMMMDSFLEGEPFSPRSSSSRETIKETNPTVMDHIMALGESQVEENAQPQQKRRRIKKEVRVDSRTEIPSRELLDWRENYSSAMKAQTGLRDARQANLTAKDDALKYIYGWGGQIVHPNLTRLFIFSGYDALTRNGKKRTRDEGININAEELRLGCGGEHFSQVMDDHDIGMGYQNDNRNSPLGNYDLELGRRDGESLNRTPSIVMPWNITMTGSRLDSVGQSRSVSAAGFTSTSNARDFSYIDTPLGQGRRSGRTSKMAASPLGGLARVDSADPTSNVADLTIDDAVVLDDFEVFQDDLVPVVMQGTQEMMEHDCKNFLEYVRTKLAEDKSRYDKSPLAEFSELVPFQTSNKNVASQALCHVLRMSKRVMHVNP